MNVMNKIADRMLAVLAPTVTAKAGKVCTPSHYLVNCKCSGGLWVEREEYLSSSCTISYGPCNVQTGNKC